MKIFIYLFLLIFISSCSNISNENYTSSIDSSNYYENYYDSISAPSAEYDDMENEIRIPKVKSIKKIIKEEDPFDKQFKYIGDITHVVNDTMIFGKPHPVDLVISYKTPIDIISQEVESFRRNPNNLNTQKIKITPLMKAKLIDPTKNSFQIIPITDSIQQVDMEEGTYTMWLWKVIPIRGGSNELVLNVDIIIGDNKKSLKIYNDIIYVEIKTIDKITGWIERNWKYVTYIISTIGIIIAWLYKEQLINIFRKKQND